MSRAAWTLASPFGQTVTTRSASAIASMRSVSSSKGTFSLPGMWPRRNDAGDDDDGDDSSGGVAREPQRHERVRSEHECAHDEKCRTDEGDLEEESAELGPHDVLDSHPTRNS